MPFPSLSYCLICDVLRPEVGSKLTILGFYGLAPNVDVRVVNQNSPVNLSFLAGFPAVQDARPYAGTLIVTKPNGTTASQTGPVAIQVVAGRGGAWGVGCIIAPPHIPGRHSVRFLINNEVKLETSFTLSLANQAELEGFGIPIPPAPRPN